MVCGRGVVRAALMVALSAETSEHKRVEQTDDLLESDWADDWDVMKDAHWAGMLVATKVYHLVLSLAVVWTGGSVVV